MIQRLSNQGMTAIIAPVTEVEPKMAGEYSRALAEVLDEHKSDEQYSLSQAHFDTLQKLKETYQGLILTYTLLGNGNLRLCAPEAKKPTNPDSQ